MAFRTSLLVSIAALAVIVTACGDGTGDTLPSLGNVPGIAALGEPAPDFTVDTWDGETWHGPTFTLSEHLAGDGRPVFLNLWASWCGPCRAEMPAIDEAAARHPEVLFLGVAAKDDRGHAREFAKEIGVDYLLAFDELTQVDSEYQPIGLPVSYIISSDGIILEEEFGALTVEEIDEKLAAHFG